MYIFSFLAEFGSLDWSPDEKQLVYVAEKKVKKSEPFIKRKPAEDKSNVDKKPVPVFELLFSITILVFSILKY